MKSGPWQFSEGSTRGEASWQALGFHQPYSNWSNFISDFLFYVDKVLIWKSFARVHFKKKSVAISKNVCNLKPIKDLLSGNVGLFLVKQPEIQIKYIPSPLKIIKMLIRQ